MEGTLMNDEESEGTSWLVIPAALNSGAGQAGIQLLTLELKTGFRSSPE
jgi:hypothetical protein